MRTYTNDGGIYNINRKFRTTRLARSRSPITYCTSQGLRTLIISGVGKRETALRLHYYIVGRVDSALMSWDAFHIDYVCRSNCCMTVWVALGSCLCVLCITTANKLPKSATGSPRTGTLEPNVSDRTRQQVSTSHLVCLVTLILLPPPLSLSSVPPSFPHVTLPHSILPPPSFTPSFYLSYFTLSLLTLPSSLSLPPSLLSPSPLSLTPPITGKWRLL